MTQPLQLYIDRVHAWRRASVNRRIFAAMVTVGSVTLVLKGVAMAKDVVVAARFGTSDAMDAFLIALVLPGFAVNVVAGSLPAAFVPVYVRARTREGADSANRLLTSVLCGAGGLLALATVALAIASPYILPALGAAFDGEKLALTRRLFVLLLPTVVISGLSTALGAARNAREQFIVPASTPGLISLSILLALAIPGGGAYALAAGLVMGHAFELGVLAWRADRHGLLAFPSWRVRHPATRQVLAQYAPMLGGSALMASAPLVDQSMAAMLGAGSVSSFVYGTKIVAAGLGIGTTAMSTAIFPHFASMVAGGDWAGARHTLRTYSRLIALAAVPVVLLLVVGSEPIVRTLFERGAFTAADTAAVARVQALYTLQIPFYLLGILGVRLLSATSGNHLLMWISAANFVVNVVGNYVLMRLWGVAGIALSTSSVYAISAVVIFVLVRRRIQRLAEGGATLPTRP